MTFHLNHYSANINAGSDKTWRKKTKVILKIDDRRNRLLAGILYI